MSAGGHDTGGFGVFGMELGVCGGLGLSWGFRVILRGNREALKLVEKFNRTGQHVDWYKRCTRVPHL